MKKQITKPTDTRHSRRPKQLQRKSPSAFVSMDNKQRVSLTRMLSKEERDIFSSFRIYREGSKIVLEPVFQIPERDHWIYTVPEAFTSLMKGIKDAEEGRLHDLGSFAKYAEQEDEELDEKA